MMPSVRLILFTVLWTAMWAAPLPRLPRRLELLAGLIPFAAFGLRVFAGFFVGVPDDDPLRGAVGPLLDWVGGSGGMAGLPPYQWVLDATVALGLVWFASAFDIPRQSRLATAAIIPAVAAASLASLHVAGLPPQQWLARHLPAPLCAAAVGLGIAVVIRWTPGPLAVPLRRRAAAVAMLAVPAVATIGWVARQSVSRLPVEQIAQAESVIALTAGGLAGLAAWRFGGFTRPRSRWLFGLVVGVATGASVALSGGVSRHDQPHEPVRLRQHRQADR